MPEIPVNSANITTFAFKATLDIYNKSIVFVDQSSYVSGGASAVLGICFEVVDGNGVPYHNINFTAPDILPASESQYTLDLSSFGLPFLLGNTFKITGAIKDSDGNIYYTTPVYKTICKVPSMTELGYVPGMFQVIPICPDNTLTVKELTLMVYDGKKPSSVTKTGTFYYPTGTINPVPFTGTPFTNNQIYTGENRVNCTTVATYDINDNIFVAITYLTKQAFPVTCNSRMMDLMCCLADVEKTSRINCDNAIGADAKQKMMDVSFYLMVGLGKEINGQDASFEADFIRKRLNCDCGATSLGQNEQDPINPAVTSIVLSGVGGTSIDPPTVNGNTKNFVIASSIYQVLKGVPGDLAWSIEADTTQPFNVKYKITFNYNKMALAVLTAIGADDTLLTLLNSLISVTNFQIDLSNLNGRCVIDLSSVNYFLSFKVPATSATVKNILIGATTYNASGGLLVTNTDGIEAWLNGLGLGTFSASFSTSSSGSFVNILTLANANNPISVTFTTGSDVTINFQKTNKSIIAVLQAIVDYLCAISAAQVALGNNLSLCTFDYNGQIVTTNYSSTGTQGTFNAGVAAAICNLANMISTLTGITCEKIAAVFPASPNETFGAGGSIYGNSGAGCVAWSNKQVALGVIAAINAFSDVKEAYCAIDCLTPAECPEISNVSLNMVGSDIGLYGLTWGITPLAVQTVTVQYKLSSSPTWITATSSLQILPNGNINGTTPYHVVAATPGATYNVRVFNNCGGVGFTTSITAPTGSVYSASFLFDASIYNICGDSPVTLYSSAPFAPGITMYANAGLTIPLTGYNFIAPNATGEIFNINSGTGVVGVSTGTSCNTGTPGKFMLDNSSSGICAGAFVTLYTNGTFAIGKTLYTDSALTNPVTGYSFVWYNANKHIYDLNSSTGQVLSDTGITCAYYTTIVKFANTEFATCGASPTTVYSPEPFQTGVVLYTDTGLTTIATGHNYVADASGVIYTINPVSGLVGPATGNAC